MSIKIKLFDDKIRILKKQNQKALSLATDIIAQRIDQEVPFDTGATSRSVLSANSKKRKKIYDKKNKKIIYYRTPYAQRIYFGVNFKFQKTKHPRAQAFWGRKLMSNKQETMRIFAGALKVVKNKK